MNAEARQEALKRIQEDPSNDTGERIIVHYRGAPKTFKVYRIPLEYIVYNPHNGRIASSVSSYEAQHHELDPEVDADREVIERLLWDSHPTRNKRTYRDLLKNGQRERGLLTSDGMVVAGNRRTMLLNKIAQDPNRNEHGQAESLKYFNAAILPERATRDEIMRLEAEFQMGDDPRLDYEPIEKYLMARNLQRAGHSDTDISTYMGYEQKEIQRNFKILKLMDEYLNYVGYPEIYTRLERREGQFVDLQSRLEGFESRPASVHWAFTEDDLSMLKKVAFDYIRAQYPVAQLRALYEVFKEEGSWRPFLSKHAAVDEYLTEEPSIDDMRRANPGDDHIYERRDNDYKERLEETLEENLKDAGDDAGDIKKANRPVLLLEKAIRALERIDEHSEAYQDNNQVSAMLADLKRRLDELEQAPHL